jgi:adenylate cyclase
MRCPSFKGTCSCLLRGLVVLVVLLGSYVGFLNQYELDMLDLRFRLRPKIPVTDKITLIEIDNSTIEKLGQFPFDRSSHTILVKALSEVGAKAIVFDIFFSEPSLQDKEFEGAMRLAGNVYLPYVFELEKRLRNHMLNALGYMAGNRSEFIAAAQGTGHSNVIPDIDGKLRRVPLLIRYRDTQAPYLAFLVTSQHLGLTTKDFALRPGRSLQLGKKRQIPLDENSNVIVNFSGRWGTSYQHYSYVDVLRSYIAGLSGETPVLDLKVFKDKICIIGLTAAGATTLHPTPFEPLYPAMGIHAEVINSILTGQFITPTARWINLFILIVLSLLAFGAAFRPRPLKALLLLCVLVASYLLFNIVVFDVFGWWLDLFYPTVTMAAVYLVGMLCKYIAEWKHRLLLENELQIAKQIQESFLPKTLPQYPNVDIAARMTTARHVGGDLYDFLEYDADQLGVMIGDVSGKGVPASLFMTMAGSSFHFYAKAETKPEETLALSNSKVIKESSANLFVTMFYAIFDFQKKVMTYANGGHLPVLYLAKGKVSEFLDVEKGLPLGLLENSYTGNQTSFGSGDIFVFYTDGITEAQDQHGELYGKERLIEVVERNRHLSAGELLAVIENDAHKFEPKDKQHDDMTAIVIRING